ncbi:MAG: hypothetical protein ABI835_18535, partial [Chloroflexota bacterium]
ALSVHFTGIVTESVLLIREQLQFWRSAKTAAALELDTIFNRYTASLREEEVLFYSNRLIILIRLLASSRLEISTAK